MSYVKDLGLVQEETCRRTLTVFPSSSSSCSSIIQSIFSLYWSLFGLMPREAVQSNTIPRVLESAGTLLYASFYIFTVVVLLNALIAVMSNVYNQVEVGILKSASINRAPDLC